MGSFRRNGKFGVVAAVAAGVLMVILAAMILFGGEFALLRGVSRGTGTAAGTEKAYPTGTDMTVVQFKSGAPSAFVEGNLAIIMSSPMWSSNAQDYIDAHRPAYDIIVKYGDASLQYMLSQFEKGGETGLRGVLMMSLCIDILGDRNNVAPGTYTNPQDWYSKLRLDAARMLPRFTTPPGSDEHTRLVYEAATEKYGRGRIYPADTVTITAVKLYGYIEKGNELKLLATVFYKDYRLTGSTFKHITGGIIPAAVTFVKSADGAYILKNYIEAKDGGLWAESIKNFCAPRGDIAEKIIKDYSNTGLGEIIDRNVREYLASNGFTGITAD